MKTLIVGFSSHYSIFSKLIRVITASKISHTYIRILNFYGAEDMVFQASGLTVNYTNYQYFQRKSKVIEEYEMQVSDKQYDTAMTLMSKSAGKPYSMPEILGILYVLFMREWMKKCVKNPYRNGDKSYICSELAAECLGLWNTEAMTPEDLRRYCNKNGKLIN